MDCLIESVILIRCWFLFQHFRAIATRLKTIQQQLTAILPFARSKRQHFNRIKIQFQQPLQTRLLNLRFVFIFLRFFLLFYLLISVDWPISTILDVSSSFCVILGRHLLSYLSRQIFTKNCILKSLTWIIKLKNFREFKLNLLFLKK